MSGILKKGLIQVYTGNGKGKTTAALGQAFRASGHGLKTIMIQFMKGSRDCGEIRASELIRPYLTIEPMGRNCLIDRQHPEPVDFEYAQKALGLARKHLTGKEYDIVILDEVNVAIDYGLIDLQSVLDLIDRRPDEVELIITGRYAPQEIIDRADLVTEMVERKHYYQRGVKERVGIER
jgi:cob(I)alamin adenosyltransferase